MEFIPKILLCHHTYYHSDHKNLIHKFFHIFKLKKVLVIVAFYIFHILSFKSVEDTIVIYQQKRADFDFFPQIKT